MSTNKHTQPVVRMYVLLGVLKAFDAYLYCNMNKSVIYQGWSKHCSLSTPCSYMYIMAAHTHVCVHEQGELC